jgi:lipopolysaccharide export system permease protein
MINIINKYITKNFIKIFVFLSLVIATIGTIYELFKRLGFYLEYNTAPLTIILHLICSIPHWFVQTLPIVTLLSVLFSIGDLSKNNEITAMKALGINIYKIILLLLILGFVIGVYDFTIREFIITKTSKYTEFIKTKQIMKKNVKSDTEFYNLVFTASGNDRIMIDYLNVDKKIIKNIMIDKYNDNFEIISIIIAQYGIWDKTRWILYNGVLRSFNRHNALVQETYFRQYISNIMIKPSDMKIVLKEVNYTNMSTYNLMTYIKKLRLFGQSETRVRDALMAIYIRYASIFSHIVVMIIGVPFILSTQIKNNIVNFIIALLIALTYFWIQSLTKSLGENFLLSPFLAAWCTNIVSIVYGIYLIIKLRK